MGSGGIPIAVEGNEVLFLGFNQDHACFACGTETGFRIYNCDPFKERCRRDFPVSGGVGHVEMLYRCNIIALVGGGKNPKYSPTKVMIWDDQQGKCIGELSFRNDVKAVRLRRDRVVVVLEYKIYVYNFSHLTLLQQIETAANPKGLCALSPSSSQTVLACPGFKKGHVRIELYNQKKNTHIAAHNGALSCLAINTDGTRLATASEKGTIIRVYDTHTGDLLRELRRGTNRAEVLSIAFNSLSTLLCSSSDTGTVHVFSLLEGGGAGGETQQEASSVRVSEDASGAAEEGGAAVVPAKSAGFSLKSLLPAFLSSNVSFSQFKVTDSRSICAFGADGNSVVVITASGAFYQCSFDIHRPGDCRQESYSRFTGGDADAPPAAPVV